MAEPSRLLDAGANFHHRVLDACPNGVYVHDLQRGAIIFANVRYARLTGYDMARLEKLEGPTFHALFHPEDRPRVSDHLRALRSVGDGDVREIEYRLRRADGTWIWCISRDAAFERDATGSVRSIIGTFIDISDSKRTDETLRVQKAESEARLRELEAIYTHAPIGLCVLDADLRFVRVNEQLARINGLPVAGHIGRTVREVLPKLADDAEPRLRRVIETGEPTLDIEIRGVTPSGSGTERFWLESWLPLRDQNGAVVGINVVAREVTDERKYQVSLAESREHYRLVADYTYNWEDWVGPDGAPRWVSPSCRRITGHSPEAFLADPGLLERIALPEDRLALRKHLTKALHDREPTKIQFRIRRADGEIRWLEHICQPVYRQDGAFAGRRGSTRDITEARQAKEALLRREQEFVALVENTPDIVARFDRSLRHLYVNAALERMTGRTRSELIGRTNEELGMSPGLSARWSAFLQEVFNSGESRSLDFAFPTPEGERLYNARAVPERGPDGAIETLLCVTRDETERRSAEVKTRALAQVVETSADFIGITRLDGEAVYLNRAGQILVGLNGDEAVRATRIEDYLFPADLPIVRETVLPNVLRDGHWADERRFRHFSTGEPIDVHWDMVRIDDSETGQPLYFATVARDIRKQKKAEATLLEASRRKDEFLAMLGHELRNPMGPIRNAIDILHLLSQGGDPRVDGAIELLDDLLDVSRIVRGKLKLECRPVRLSEVVQQSTDSVRPLMNQRRHRFDVKLPEDWVRVDGDPVRLAQILLNLLRNAADYTPEGGAIRVVTESNEQEVCVRVCDNGPGIPAETIEELFTPFSRGQGRDDMSAGGLGLGLAISRQLAELHGGRLDARSRWPRPGSEFRVHLPLLTEPAEPLARPEGRAEGPRRTERMDHLSVLVVDDDADVAGAMTMLLQVLGCHVQTATTGAEAIVLAEQTRPRLALLDIGLPDMDGLELARRLREKLPEKDRLLLVAVTGFGHDEARERSFAAGFDQHLAKPVDLPTLRALLQSTIP
jgi:PAS domain S-box-containing protein